MLIHAFLVGLFAASAFEPAQLQRGSVPGTPPATVGGGEVLLDVTVDTAGRVARIRTLRETPPFTELLQGAVTGWSFSPASAEGRPVAAHVLVAGLFRPPVLVNAPVLGEPPRDVAAASDALPLPTSLIPPPYPPDRQGDAIVLVEVELADDGRVKGARIVGSASAFDAAAEQTARQWRFRPGRWDGTPVPAVAYLVFGFRQPVVPPVPPPPPRP